MTWKRSLIYATFAMGLLCQPAWADRSQDDHKHGNKHAKHHDDDDQGEDSDHRAAMYWFRPHDVQIITEYYAPERRSLPPGLAKKYYRTGHLPPGWQKKIQPLPVVIERQLIVLPPDYRRGVIDGYAVVYNPRTQVMIDVTAVFGR